MKSNVILNSADRMLFGITIKQETKGCFLSVTDLQNAYERARYQYGWSDKRISDILSNESTKERFYYLLKEQGSIKATFPVFIEMVEKEGIVNVLKGLGTYKTTGRGSNKTVMCDPFIWMLLAMELNPMIYAKVIIWLTDTLIFDRIEAGTEYMPMNASIKKIVENPDYPKYAKAINTKVFSRHETGIRNIAKSDELKQIADIEKFVTKSINIGMVKTEQQVMYLINNF